MSDFKNSRIRLSLDDSFPTDLVRNVSNIINDPLDHRDFISFMSTCKHILTSLKDDVKELRKSNARVRHLLVNDVSLEVRERELRTWSDPASAKT